MAYQAPWKREVDEMSSIKPKNRTQVIQSVTGDPTKGNYDPNKYEAGQAAWDKSEKDRKYFQNRASVTNHNRFVDDALAKREKKGKATAIGRASGSGKTAQNPGAMSMKQRIDAFSTVSKARDNAMGFGKKEIPMDEWAKTNVPQDIMDAINGTVGNPGAVNPTARSLAEGNFQGGGGGHYSLPGGGTRSFDNAGNTAETRNGGSVVEPDPVDALINGASTQAPAPAQGTQAQPGIGGQPAPPVDPATQADEDLLFTDLGAPPTSDSRTKSPYEIGTPTGDRLAAQPNPMADMANFADKYLGGAGARQIGRGIKSIGGGMADDFSRNRRLANVRQRGRDIKNGTVASRW